jgi:hypothetical protein
MLDGRKKMFSFFFDEQACNLSKCQQAPIRCDANQVQLATSIFPCQVTEFPHQIPKSASLDQQTS